MELSQSNRKLRHLSLRGMRLRKSLLSVFQTHATSLVALDLSECDDEVTDEMALALANCVNLVELQLEGAHKIRSSTLASIVAACPHLVVLALSGCRVDDSVIRALFEGPNDSPNTQQGSQSEFTNDSPIINRNSDYKLKRRALHTLLIGSCLEITSRSLDFLCSADRLRVLKVSRCEFINPQSVIRLASSLSELRILDISACPKLPRAPFKPSNVTGEAASPAELGSHELLMRQLVSLLPHTKIIA